ncbi:MAG: leucyl aminopeptidase [Nanoarchaeota archaeon]|nr:leucyl aminopeptidase [Nanoarchaeota archaeon]
MDTMQITAKKEAVTAIKTQAIVLPLLKGFSKSQFKQLDDMLDKALSNTVDDNMLDEGSFTQIFTNKKMPAEQIIIAGLGEKKKYTKNSLRKTAANLARFLKSKKITEFAVSHDFKKDEVGCFAEGLLLGNYVFDEYKTKKEEDRKKELKQCIIIAKEAKKTQKEIDAAAIIAESTIFARSLGNRPAIVATPEYMAKQALALAKLPKVTCKILDEQELRKENMDLLLGVSAGSPHPPKMVVLHYKNSPKHPTVLIGKGVTFDTGGTNLKPTGYIEGMQYDMDGAAVVMATVRAAALLKLPVNIYGIAPLTENIIGGKAIKPGDIIKSASGKTVEIANTDAEGRLILSDALHYSLRYKPAQIIDIATLTGATIVALGKKVASVMGNNDVMIRKLISAGEETGERLWQLPLFDEFADDIKSDVADVKNMGLPKGEAATIAAGMFLKEFVKDARWAHVDIGGTADISSDSGYISKGATGFGVRLFIEYLSKK